MMSCFAYSTGYTTRNIIFEITIKSLVFTIFNFKISKITTAVLGGQRSFFHINIGVFLFLFGVCVVSTGISTILIIKRTVGSIIWYFTHTFRINWHWLVSFLCHSENFTHWRIELAWRNDDFSRSKCYGRKLQNAIRFFKRI